MDVYQKLKVSLPGWNYIVNLFQEKQRRYVLKILKDCYDSIESGCISENTKYMCSSLYTKQWEVLNTGHWSLVEIESRQIYTLLSYLQALFLLKELPTANNIKKSLSFIDYGLLLGASLENTAVHPRVSDLLTDAGSYLNVELYNISEEDSNVKGEFIAFETNRIQCPNKMSSVPLVDQPSIEHFRDNFFKPKFPVLLSNCLNHWPAIKNWKDVDYLLKAAGERTIPVEIGKNYTQNDWSQGLMTFKNFIKEQMATNRQTKRIKYLAQHNLFDQVPELRGDISIPDYCVLTEDENSKEEPDIKSWFGPEGTISPLHYDIKHNLLCQVLGQKKVILARPDDTVNIYPHDNFLLNNTSQVDAENLDFINFPLTKNVKFYEIILENGMMLYIPPKWWHYVRSLSNSFSVSFWWE